MKRAVCLLRGRSRSARSPLRDSAEEAARGLAVGLPLRPAPGPHLPGRPRRRGRAAGSAAAARGAARPRAHTGTAAPASFALAAPARSASRPRRAPGSPASRRRGRGRAETKAAGRRSTQARPLRLRLPSRPPPSGLLAVPCPAPQVPPTPGGGASAGQAPPPRSAFPLGPAHLPTRPAPFPRVPSRARRPAGS